ncbi:hypothetical protein LguiA_012041 [Lonicera macranthoides]
MEEQGKSGRRRLVLVPSPFQGHISPMLQLGTVLHSKGFSITIAHAKINGPDPSNHPDLEFQAFAKDLPELNPSGDVIRFIADLNTGCKSPFEEWLGQKMEQKEPGNQVACIIYDTLMYFSEAVASEMKIPSIVLRTSCPSYLLAYHAISRLKEEGFFPLQDSMLLEPVPGLHPLRFKDLPFSNLTMEALRQLLAITSNMRNSSAIIWNTNDYLEHSSLSKLRQEHYQMPFFPVGPLHIVAPPSSTSLLKDDNSCIEWLDKQAPNSVIYVSLGSIATIDEKELAETAWGLANSDQPFLWTFRPGSVRGSEWVELLPESFREKVGERCKIVKWAPQKEVLAHRAVGGFWSHCGWNSTLESICEGVPMICRPCFVDQKVNARYLSYVWKVGLELEYVLERGEIERSVRRLMVENEGEEMRQRAIDMKEKVMACVRKGGSSYNSLNDLTEFILSF